MKEIILSIISVSLIVTVFNLILPKGRMSDIIRYCLSFISITIMISPLIIKNDWFNINFDIDKEILYDENLLDYINSNKIFYDEKNCNEIIKKYGISDASTKIEYTVNDIKICYNGVAVYGCNYIHELAVTLSEYLNIPIKEVKFYEWHSFFR